MTLKTFYRATNLMSFTYLETVNVESARNKMNDADFEVYLKIKLNEIIERNSSRRLLIIQLWHREQMLRQMTREELQHNFKTKNRKQWK